MPYVRAGDLNVYYVEVSQATGLPVVFVHGNWTSSTSWEPVLKRLPAGWRGIAYDVRGRGKTQGPNSGYSIPELAADLRDFVDALGLDRFHLVAHSLGTAIALQFALESSERLRSITLVAAGWVDGMPRTGNSPFSQRALKASRTIFARGLKMMMPTMRDESLYRRLVEEGHAQRIEAALGAIPALLNWKPGDRLRQISVPKLVVTGERDFLVGGATGRRAAEALGAPQIVFRGRGHSPNIEAPDEFVKLLTAHITSAERAWTSTSEGYGYSGMSAAP